MKNRTESDLYELVKCMSRSEKRIFSMQTGSKKLLKLFDAVKENKPFRDKQVHNLRAVLYKQLLDSIRPKNVEGNLHQAMERAKLLFERKLYLQCYKSIGKVKATATIYHQVSFQLQALNLEKKIRAMHVIENSSYDIKRLQEDSRQISNELSSISHYSLQSLLLYGHYARWGTLRLLPDIDLNIPVYGFYSKMYKFQCLLYTALIKGEEQTQYASALCNHFKKIPHMKVIEQVQYEKAKYFLQTNIHIPETKLKDEPIIISSYFNYATYLYDEKNFSEALDYLIQIVNTKLSVRIDLQIKARQLHIECHKALGNDEIIYSLEKSFKGFRKKYSNGAL